MNTSGRTLACVGPLKVYFCKRRRTCLSGLPPRHCPNTALTLKRIPKNPAFPESASRPSLLLSECGVAQKDRAPQANPDDSLIGTRGGRPSEAEVAGSSPAITSPLAWSTLMGNRPPRKHPLWKTLLQLKKTSPGRLHDAHCIHVETSVTGVDYLPRCPLRHCAMALRCVFRAAYSILNIMLELAAFIAKLAGMTDMRPMTCLEFQQNIVNVKASISIAFQKPWRLRGWESILDTTSQKNFRLCAIA